MSCTSHHPVQAQVGVSVIMEYKGLPAAGRRLPRQGHDVEYPKTTIINN